jgi:mannose-6-phosphate isomerase-like protein (cupin superfamily)
VTCRSINNDEADEIPFREGYRVQTLAGADHGMTCIVNIRVIEPGAGAPLHVHPEVDEVSIVREGTLDVRLGPDRRQVGPNHTLVIPGGRTTRLHRDRAHACPGDRVFA